MILVMARLKLPEIFADRVWVKVCSRNFLLISLGGLGAIALFGGGGCSAPEVVPPPEVPEYTRLPHPAGTSALNEVRAIFREGSAPDPDDFSKDCDEEVKKVLHSNESKEQVRAGIDKLVKEDPIHYHWCFYAKILVLEQDLKKLNYIDERQKRVLDTFEFLSPVARSFSSVFHDPRYLRSAVDRYRKISEWVFFRRLELTPQGTEDMLR